MGNGVCAVVGVGPGLGMALCRRFGREGLRIAVLARRFEPLRQAAEALAAEGITAQPIAADAGSTESLEHAFGVVRETMGDPEVLIYNAAVLRQGAPLSLPAAELVETFKTNVAGALVAAQQVAPAMRRRGSGTILLTGGGLAIDPWPKYASLAVGKAGLRNLALSLAKELEPASIHVATVTIRGNIAPDTRFDPERIAQEYWRLHRQARESWQREVLIE
jgi:NAD(P)-dependent dehydrogenase (short-subunit alcohol dehydrogenase family)